MKMAGGATRRARRARLAWGAGAAVVMAFLYLPMLVVVLYAFSKETINTWPFHGWSLRWFRTLLADPEPIDALRQSVLVALLATAAALLLGTLAAFALHRYRFRGREAMTFAAALPITLPGIVTGIAMLSFFVLIGYPRGLATVVLGHTTFCLVLVLNNVLARLRQTGRGLQEASADLGAGPLTTFRRVTFPSIRTAMLAGALLAFTLSFDEIVVTFFLNGTLTTLPIWILGRIRLGRDFPEINAAASGVIVLSLLLILASQRLLRDEPAA